MQLIFLLVLTAAPASLAQGTLTPEDAPFQVVLGDFISLPGGRGNIAEFGKALRLPSFSERNLVQFHKYGDWYHHRFRFHNTSRVLEFKFKFGQKNTIFYLGKTIEYVYEYEPTTDPDRATVFARYEEVGGDVRFTVESIFTRSGMTTTYTHADVLDNIMARRRYKRVIAKSALGFYENDPTQQSRNFPQFSSVLPRPVNASYSSKNKLYFGQEGNNYFVEEIVDPETRQVIYPFSIGVKQRMFVEGKNLEYVYHVHQVENTTLMKGEFATGAVTYQIDYLFGTGFLNATYRRGNLTASRVYRRVLPRSLYGTYESIPDGVENYGDFAKVFTDPVIGASPEATSRIRFSKQDKTYRHEIINYMGSSETVEVSFDMVVPTSITIGGKSYQVFYSYEGGEKPVLTVVFSNAGESESSFTVTYGFDSRGIEARYRRETTEGAVAARRYYRRLLPAVVIGSYRTVEKSSNFDAFADSIHFPELKLPTTTTYLESNGSYFQNFQYDGQQSKFSSVPFVLGEKHHQLVKGTWWMEYVYSAIEGDRIILQSVFYPKPNSGNPPKWEPFTRIGDFTHEGYTAIYVCGNATARRIYHRLPNTA